MLSFSSYSELPLSSSVSSLEANSYITGAIFTASAGTLGYEAEAKITNASVSATFTAEPFADVDAKASTNLPTPAAAILYSGTIQGSGQGTVATTGVTASVSAGIQTANGKATTTPAAATSTFATGILDYDAEASTVLPSIAASTLTITSFEDEDAQGSAVITGVSAATTADWDTVNGIYTFNVVYSNTDFERTRTVNIVPYGNYKVYVTR